MACGLNLSVNDNPFRLTPLIGKDFDGCQAKFLDLAAPPPGPSDLSPLSGYSLDKAPPKKRLDVHPGSGIEKKKTIWKGCQQSPWLTETSDTFIIIVFRSVCLGIAETITTQQQKAAGSPACGFFYFVGRGRRPPAA